MFLYFFERARTFANVTEWSPPKMIGIASISRISLTKQTKQTIHEKTKRTKEFDCVGSGLRHIVSFLMREE